MTISVVFDPPLPSDNPADFNTKAFALLGDLNTWSTQANALPGEVATNLSALLAAPPAIGSTTPAAGSFTTVTASSPITLTSANPYVSFVGTAASQQWRIGDGLNATNGNLVVYDHTGSIKALEITKATGAVTIPGNVGVGSSPLRTFSVKGGTNQNFIVNASSIGFLNDAGSAWVPWATYGETQAMYVGTGGATLGLSIAATGAVTIPGILNIGNPSNTSYALSVSGISGAHKVFLRRTDNNANGMALWTDADGSFNLEYRTDADVAVSGPLFTVNYGGAVTIPGSLSVTGSTLGYGTGAGGTVTQATSKSTAVTLNKACGKITMNNAALAAGASVSVFVTNIYCATTSTVQVSMVTDGVTDLSNYSVQSAIYGSGGAFYLLVRNVSAWSLSDALQVRFSITSGANA